MYIAPIYNIRHPGLIANGFQKEDAPAPTPDQSCQPDIRIKAQAMTDTRHAVEMLNPTAHLEINAANRTDTSNKPAHEMGRSSSALVRHLDGVIRDKRLQDYEHILNSLFKHFQTIPIPKNSVQEFFDSL